MALTYSTYVAQIANLMATSSSTTEFQTMLPGAIDYAEQRIYRELDLLSTIVRDSSASLTATDRNFTLPTSAGRFVTVQGINVVTPVGVAPDSGTRNQLLPMSREYLESVWQSGSGADIPQFFAMIDDQHLILGPWPNNSYVVEVIGTIRPTPLSSTNTTTFLTNYLPDILIAATMIFTSAYMRNFGAQSDSPQMAQSWESQYQTLMKSAVAEELRRKFSGLGWTSYSNAAPTPER